MLYTPPSRSYSDGVASSGIKPPRYRSGPRVLRNCVFDAGGPTRTRRGKHYASAQIGWAEPEPEPEQRTDGRTGRPPA
jgi:hypothetical protein